MKKYRLKKDTPALKAGMLFELKDSRLFLRESEDCVAIPVFQRDGVANFDEWFEEVKEFEKWKPKEGEVYKFLYSNGEAISISFDGSEIDQHYLSIGNAYPLDTPDEVIIKEQKLIPQAMHRLKIAAKKAWFEFDGSEGPDWANLDRDKFAIVYEHWRSALKTLEVTSVHDLGQVYFPTEKSAQAYIDNNQDDLKLLFGVK